MNFSRSALYHIKISVCLKNLVVDCSYVYEFDGTEAALCIYICALYLFSGIISKHLQAFFVGNLFKLS